ncbi:unnamed protein product, partial [Adineta steineri]
FFVGIQPSFGCIILNENFIEYASYFFYLVLAGLFPILIASSFSLLAYRNVRCIIRRQIPIERRRFDRQITKMILFRVVLFVIFTLPYTIYRIYAINIKINSTDVLRIAIEGLFQIVFLSFFDLNYAVTFYVFLLSIPRYRRQVKYVLINKYWKQLKNSCFPIENQVHPENIVTSHTNIDLE